MELKPCPLCGSDAEMYFDRLGGKTIYMVKCSVGKCQCQEMGWHETEDEAIAIWNSRPIEDDLRSRIEILTKAYESLPELIVGLDSGDLYDANNLSKVLDEHLKQMESK